MALSPYRTTPRAARTLPRKRLLVACFLQEFQRLRLPRPSVALRCPPCLIPSDAAREHRLRTQLRSRGPRQLVLRLRLEIAGVMALVQLARWFAAEAVDHPPPLNRRARMDHFGP